MDYTDGLAHGLQEPVPTTIARVFVRMAGRHPPFAQY